MRRSPEAAAAPWVALLATALMVAGFFVRESRLGRFKPLAPQQVDAEWVAQNILTLPAEVVGAAWDGAVNAPEVVALIARMVTEGKLASETAADGTLALKLIVERASLQDYERALVDGLFFDGRAATSTAQIKAHYKSTGFNPAGLIAPGLEARVTQVLPSEDNPRVSWHVSAVLLPGVFVMLAYEMIWNGAGAGSFVFVIFALALGLLAKLPGLVFRRRIDWGPVAAMLCLIPALLVAASFLAFLWYPATPDAVELSGAMLGVVAILAVWIPHSALNALKSRQNPAAIAFRKKLAAGRLFFKSQLKEERPALQDSWYPWVLAYGLAGDADQRSTRHAPSTGSLSSSSSSASTVSADVGWTGFGGGRSGGAGGGATWAAAAAGMAAGVSSPSSSGSSGGGGSSGGSSGGGGGGGW